MTNNFLGEQVRMTRLAHHLSQEETACYSHISQSYLSMLESGEKTAPDALYSWIIYAIEHSGEGFLGRTVFTEKFNKGGIQMSIGNYPYLASEDASFAKAFRLTEDEVLGLFNGLSGYIRHRADRTKCRELAQIEIPKLSIDLEGEVEKYELAEVDEKQIAKILVDEQKTKVGGGISLIKMNKQFSEQAKVEAKNIQDVKDMEMAKLRQFYAATHNVEPDSQSAKDFADAEYVRRQTGKGTIPQPL